MASLARREDLAGKVQMIYLDPPYGIKYPSNFQPEIGKRDVKDKESDLTREPEMVKAYRDTWTLGVHSYLSYLRDRLIVAKELLADTGSIFVQISDVNVHRIRTMLDEVFGVDNFCAFITYRTSVPLTSVGLPSICDYIIWYAKNKTAYKHHDLFEFRDFGEKSRFTNIEFEGGQRRGLTQQEKNQPSLIPAEAKVFSDENLVSSGFTTTCTFDFVFEGDLFSATSNKSWKTNLEGMKKLAKVHRLSNSGRTLRYKFYLDDFRKRPASPPCMP